MIMGGLQWAKTETDWRLDLGRLGEVAVTGGVGGGFFARFQTDAVGPFERLGSAQCAGVRLVRDVIEEATARLGTG
jgi:hypothetical protein